MILDTMKQRRSVRRYTEEAIPKDMLDEILKAGLLAPSSRNLKPCYFYVISDQELLAQLACAKKAGGAFLKDAGAAIVVSADEAKADTWTEDCSIALTYMDLAAAERGIGSCWVQMHLRKDADGNDAEANVRRILHLGDTMRIAGILSLGMTDAYPAAHEEESETDRIIRL